MAFCLDRLEQDYGGKISKKDLRKEYSKYCKDHKVNGKSDMVIKIVLQDLFGCVDERLRVGDFEMYDWFWVGVKWKN